MCQYVGQVAPNYESQCVIIDSVTRFFNTRRIFFLFIKIGGSGLRIEDVFIFSPHFFRFLVILGRIIKSEVKHQVKDGASDFDRDGCGFNFYSNYFYLSLWEQARNAV